MEISGASKASTATQAQRVTFDKLSPNRNPLERVQRATTLAEQTLRTTQNTGTPIEVGK